MRSRHYVSFGLCLAFAAATQSSCTEVTSSDLPSEAKAARLIAVSDTVFEGAVGQPLHIRPAVRVENQAGKPIPGVTVSFEMISPAKQFSKSTATSDALGRAMMPDATLATHAGESVITATIEGGLTASFHAFGRAGPAQFIIPVRLVQPMGAVGEAVETPPIVKVIDLYANGVAGARVTFSIEEGNSSITGAESSTDTSGIAMLGGWTLLSAGRHALLVRSGDLTAVRITTTAFIADLPCGQQNALVESYVLKPRFGAQNCVDSEGHRFDLASATISTPDWYTFTLASTDFDTILELQDSLGNLLATADSAPHSGATATITALLPAGSILVKARTRSPGVTGSYSLSVSRNEGDPCSQRFTTVGASVNAHMAPKQCDTQNEVYGDRYTIFLKEGAALNVDLLDQGYSQWHIELYDRNEVFVGISTGGEPYHEVLKYNAPRDGFYTIRIVCSDSDSYYALDIR